MENGCRPRPLPRLYGRGGWDRIIRESDKGEWTIKAAIFRAFLASGAGAAALLAASGAHAQDSAPAAVPVPAEAPVRDPDTVYLQADEFINDEENARYIARGNVEAFARGRIVRADEVEYYPADERLVARGGVTIVEPDGAIEYADSADMTNGLDEAVALDFSIRMANGALITAAYLERSEGTQNLLTRATYSPCPVCEEDPTPTWQFRARKALQDTEDKMIYYRDVTFKIAGVPIFYSPFFAHADPSVRRKTGPLLPMIGYSTITGMRYQQPYFWAIDQHQDLTITPRIMSEVAPLTGFEYRRRFWSGNIEFDATLTKEQIFDSEGTRWGDDIWRGSILGSGVFALNENWSWGFGVERITDREYLLRYSIPNYDKRGLYTGFGYALMSQVFVAGQDEDFYSSVTMADYQSLYLGPNNTVPRLLPLAEYRHTFDLNDFGRLEMVGDFSFLHREAGVEYMRATSSADWGRRFVTSPGIVIETVGRGRADIYRVGEAFDAISGAPVDGGEGRLSGLAAVDVSWPFYRPGEIGLTIEPRIQGIVSAGNHRALEDYASGFNALGEPILVQEDSFTAELNGSNLFALDKFPGLDLLEQGARLNVGASFQADWDGSMARLFVGQSFHTDPENFTVASGLSENASDYVAEVEVISGPLRTVTSIRIDPDDFKVQRLETSGTLSFGMFTLRGSYLNFDQAVTGFGRREYIGGYGEIRLTENIGIGGSIGRDLETGVTQTRSLEMSYYDDCFRITVAYIEQNYPGTLIENSNAFTLTFALATLGEFGTDTRNLIPVY